LPPEKPDRIVAGRGRRSFLRRLLLRQAGSSRRVYWSRLGVEGPLLRDGLLIAILFRWMEERPVFEIVFDRPELQVYEADLLTSARAVARNLRTISQALEMLGKKKRDSLETKAYLELAAAARLVAVRARYGVGSDIAENELGGMASKINLDDLVNSQEYPEFLMRIALRLMMKKGWSSVAKLREFKGKKPITAFDLRGYILDKETAGHLKAHRDLLNGVALRIIELAKSENVSAP